MGQIGRNRPRVAWGDLPGWLQVALGVLTVLIVAGVFGAATSSSPTKQSTPATQPTTPTGPSPPVSPAYLESLSPKGDTPQRGDIEASGRSFQHSIFYEEVGGPSTSSTCEMADNCRFTTYELGGQYHHFTANFGITTKSQNPAGLIPSAHWRVAADGVVLSQGDINANVTPSSLRISVHNAQVLELGITVKEPGIAERINVLWGNARVS